MTHGAAQVEAVEAARWAAEALGAHPLGLLGEGMGAIPSVVFGVAWESRDVVDALGARVTAVGQYAVV